MAAAKRPSPDPASNHGKARTAQPISTISTIAKSLLLNYPTPDAVAKVLVPLIDNQEYELAAVRAGRDLLLDSFNQLQAENRLILAMLAQATTTIQEQQSIIRCLRADNLAYSPEVS